VNCVIENSLLMQPGLDTTIKCIFGSRVMGQASAIDEVASAQDSSVPENPAVQTFARMGLRRPATELCAVLFAPSCAIENLTDT